MYRTLEGNSPRKLPSKPWTFAHLILRARKNKGFSSFVLWGDPVQNPPQNPAPADCLLSTRKSRFEVPERGEFGGRKLPELTVVYRISVERGQFQGHLKIRNFHPPLISGDLTHYPALQKSVDSCFFLPLSSVGDGALRSSMPRTL